MPDQVRHDGWGTFYSSIKVSFMIKLGAPAASGRAEQILGNLQAFWGAITRSGLTDLLVKSILSTA